MKRTLIAFVALAVSSVAQTLSQSEFRALGKSCVPDSDRILVTAVVRTESAFNAFALSLNYPETLAHKAGLPPGRLYLKRQPKSAAEAERWVRELTSEGVSVSVGLMQVNAESGYPIRELLNPCSNLRIGWGILRRDYERAVAVVGPGRRALRMAISAYNTGSVSAGVSNGYLRAVLKNALTAR